MRRIAVCEVRTKIIVVPYRLVVEIITTARL